LWTAAGIVLMESTTTASSMILRKKQQQQQQSIQPLATARKLLVDGEIVSYAATYCCYWDQEECVFPQSSPSSAYIFAAAIFMVGKQKPVETVQ
jgi:hypothetical protein